MSDFHVAVPADDQGAGIFGIGTSHEAALQDAYAQSQTREATVSRNDDGSWAVTHDGEEVGTHADEGEARSHAASLGFVARPCTQRLYEHVRDHGALVGHFRWNQEVGQPDDLYDEDDERA